MIIGVGTDLLDQRRVEKVHQRFGARFASRVLGENEFEQYLQAKHPVNFLAKRFAVKEAAAKALGVGIGARANLHDFFLKKTRDGAPILEIGGVARATANHLGVADAHVSLSDEPPYILAFVVLSGQRSA